MFSSPSTYRLLRLTRLLRLARIQEMSITISTMITHAGRWAGVISTGRLLLVYVLLVHWAACAWLLLVTSRVDPQGNFPTDSWIYHIGVPSMHHISVYSLYLTAFYWATTVMSTVGCVSLRLWSISVGSSPFLSYSYGDIVSKCYLERIVSIVVELIGAVVFGYVLGNGVFNQFFFKQAIL